MKDEELSMDPGMEDKESIVKDEELSIKQDARRIKHDG